MQLLREARAQLDASHADLRDAAAHSVVSLEQRVTRIAEAIKACVPDEEVQTRVQEHSGNNAAVGQENAATLVVEQNTRLGNYVQVVRGERVDGHGNVSGSEVRRMFSRISGRLQRCYGNYVDRNALEAGTAILSFTVTTSGRVRGVRVEQAMGDASFQRCLRHAGRAIRRRRQPWVETCSSRIRCDLVREARLVIGSASRTWKIARSKDRRGNQIGWTKTSRRPPAFFEGGPTTPSFSIRSTSFADLL